MEGRMEVCVWPSAECRPCFSAHPQVLDCPLKGSPFEHKQALDAGADAPGVQPSGWQPHTPSGYDAKADVWSAGVLLYEALTGRSPFAAPTVGGVLLAIRQRPIDYPDTLSPGASSLLQCMLQRDVRARMSSSALIEHPWLGAEQQ